MRGRSNFVSAAMLACAVAGCETVPFNVAPAPPAQYRALGPATGQACGFMGLGPYTFLPIDLDDRVPRAYAAAVAAVPGATGLVNVTLREDWQWFVLVTRRCVTIQGEAIQ